MKKEYHNRGKKFEVEQLTDTLAIKQEDSSERITCDKIGGVNYDANGHHVRYGYGRINALKVVNAARNE